VINNDVFAGRDLLALDDFTPEELLRVIEVAQAQKRGSKVSPRSTQPLAGKSIAIILQKPSLRTRVSFEVACVRLGAHPIVLTGAESALSRGESVSDTAKVLERYVDAIVLRTYAQSTLEEMAAATKLPVVNALSDDHHPCQGLADLLTVWERLGRFSGVRFAYVGDGNNMANTYLLGGALAGMEVVVASPAGFMPPAGVVNKAKAIAETTGASISVISDPHQAVAGADVVVTDTWASMGQEGEHDSRVEVFEPFRVDSALMAEAAPGAIFMHCLPAHRGEEVTDEVMDGPQSAIFDEAENRLHAQKALLSLLLA
jgi:ornithine carbamoyltransferase